MGDPVCSGVTCVVPGCPGNTADKRIAFLEGEVVRLTGLVQRAVGAGFELESRYEEAQKQFHNYEEWSEEQWEPIQEARNELGAIMAELETGGVSK